MVDFQYFIPGVGALRLDGAIRGNKNRKGEKEALKQVCVS